MEDSKYYIPEIEEFHVGFEYEAIPYRGHDWIHDKWSDLNNSNTCDTLEQLNDNRIKVKYLDQEDIESLGWEHGEKRGLGGFTFNSEGSTFYQMYVHDNIKEKKIIFLEIYNDYDTSYIFQGDIKNKLELKKLMKQLNIEHGTT